MFVGEGIETPAELRKSHELKIQATFRHINYNFNNTTTSKQNVKKSQEHVAFSLRSLLPEMPTSLSSLIINRNNCDNFNRKEMSRFKRGDKYKYLNKCC